MKYQSILQMCKDNILYIWNFSKKSGKKQCLYKLTNWKSYEKLISSIIDWNWLEWWYISCKVFYVYKCNTYIHTLIPCSRFDVGKNYLKYNYSLTCTTDSSTESSFVATVQYICLPPYLLLGWCITDHLYM